MQPEKEKKQKSFGLLKLILFLLLILVVSGVAIYSFMGINPLDALSDGLSGIQGRIFATNAVTLRETVKDLLEIDVNEKVSCAVVSGDLVVAGISSVRIVDQEGMEKAYIPVSLGKPFVQSYGDGAVIADLEGRYFAFLSSGKIAWEKNIDEDIVNAGISDAWVLLITNSKQTGYKRTVRAYSKDGQEVALRNVSNYYPFMVANYPGYSKTCFVVSSVEVSGLEANGMFEFLDLSMNQKASIRGTREIFGKGFPLEKDSLFIYSEKSLMAVDSMYKTAWEHKLDGFTVTAANVINYKYPVAALLDDGVYSRERRSETTVRIYNNDGTEKNSFVLPSRVSGISVKEKTAAVIAESEVLFIDQDGTIMDRYTARSDVHGVYMAKDDVAYVVTSDLVTRVKIQTGKKFLGIF